MDTDKTGSIRILVTGSRKHPESWIPQINSTMNSAYIEYISAGYPVMFIFGDATGVDAAAKDFCLDAKVPYSVYEAHWSLYDKSAGPIRNQQMIDTKPQLVLAFWDGESKGTLDTITRALAKGLNTHVIFPNNYVLVQGRK